MRPALAAALGATLLVGCAEPEAPQAAAPHPVIVAHAAAFNDRDLDGMAALQHPEIEWYGVSADGVTLEIGGREALGDMLAGYAEANPTVRGFLRDWSVNGDWVAVTETAAWQGDDGRPRSQSALAVYELEDGLIRRVWYYPAVRD